MSDLLQRLVQGTGLPERDVLRIISTAPSRYKQYNIAKRSGGTRLIAHPARELKALQKVLLNEYLDKLPVHQAAMAYRRGRSIRDNALLHAENGPILKMDFKDFFPSIRVEDWYRYCDDRGIFEIPLERYQAGRILFFRAKGTSHLRLAIGAPSSPQLSNLLMCEFDTVITRIVQRDFVTYSRYADDLTFSAKRTGYLTNVKEAVRVACKEIRWPKLIVNEEKTILATTKYHRQITGLVLTNDGKVSLGRDRKRMISAAVHKALTQSLNQADRDRLVGTLAFVHAVEPEFIARLERKHGIENFAKVRRSAESDT